MSQAKVALSLIAVLVLVGCSSYDSYSSPAATAGAPPCGPAPTPCDPCAPVAQAPCDPCGQPPPAANLGEVWCYVRVPAVTRTVEEQLCVQPETCRQEWVPPVTKEVCEQVCVCPEKVNVIPIAAKYETVCEQVLVCPAKTEWRKVACEPKSLGEGEQLGECWTLAEIPPVYETRSKQVCTSPESCREEVIPAKFETRTSTVTVQEGYYKSHPVPAVFETRCHEEVVCPSRWEWRRTTECEVPGVTGAGPMDGPPTAVGGFAPMPEPGAPMPDNTLPPAGTLPPADPFAPGTPSYP